MTRHCNVVGCKACERERRARVEADLEEYVSTIDVYDSEWDIHTHADVKFGTDARGTLIVTDLKDRVWALYAPGAWMKVDVTLAPRIESTNDASDEETDDRSAAQRQPDLPRDGS